MHIDYDKLILKGGDMFPKISYSKQLILVFVLLSLVLSAAQCGGAAPEPSAEEEPAPTQEDAPANAETSVEDEDGQQTEAENSEEDTTIIVGDAKAEQTMGVTVETDKSDVSTPRSNYGGEYRDVETSDGVNFHPYLTTDNTSRGYQSMVWDRALLQLDPDTIEYTPHMAEKYTISDDGLTFTFYLRQDLEWSDGVSLTAHDFKWSYDKVINPDNGYPYLSQLEFMTSYEALDDYTIQVKIEEVYAPALGQMSGLIFPLPRHIWEDLDWSDPEKNPEILNPTVTSGPYKLVEWERDQYIIFEANENYWYHGAPNMTKYIVEIVPDYDISFEKMKSGESDTSYIPPEKLEDAKELDNVNVYQWWSVAPSWSYIGYNVFEGSITSDKRVRHAINYAIDKQLLVDEVMQGQGKRMCSAYPDTSWVYTPDVPCYEYDPDKAVQLLAEAGYTLNDEGLMVDENGEQLKLKFLFGPHNNTSRELMAITTQDYLGDIGIEVEIQGLEWASFIEATSTENPDWDLTTGTWGGVLDPHIMFTLFSEESIPNLNKGGYVNKEMEELFTAGGATYDAEIRKKHYQEIQKILADDSPYMFLFYSQSRDGQNKRIKGIDPKPLGVSWNALDWYIEE